MKNGTLRLSYLRVYFCLVSLLTVGRLSAQYNTGLTKLGDAAEGSVWHWSVSYGYLYFTAGNPGWPNGKTGLYGGAMKPGSVWLPLYTVGQSTTPYLSADFSQEGNVTVPPGETWQFYHASSTGNGNWNNVITPISGASGSYAGVGSLLYANSQWWGFTLPSNTTKNDQTWGVRNKNTGEVYDSAVVPAGTQGAGYMFNVPGGVNTSDLELVFWNPSLKFDSAGGTWVGVTDPNQATKTVASLSAPISGTNATAGSPKPASPPVIAPSKTITASYPPGYVAPSTAQNTTTGGTIWRGVAGGGGVTDATYREGVDKQIAADADSQREAFAKAGMGAKGQGDAATSGMGAQGTANKTATENVFGGVPSMPSAITVTANAPDFTVTLPASMGGKTFNLDPFAAGRFGTLADWFRAACGWLLGVLFVHHLVTVAGPYVRGISQAQQAKGNPVVAGTGAQATALVAAGLMTAAIIACIAAILALLMSNVGFGTISGLVAANPYAGLPGACAYILDRLFPLGLVVLYFVGRPIVELAFMKIYAAASTLVRFIVP